MFNILYKKSFSKSKLNVKIAAYCCDCVESLAKENVIKAFKSKRNEAFIAGSSLLAVPLICIPVSYILLLSFFLIISIPAILAVFFSLSFYYSSVKLTRSIKNSPVIKQILENKNKFLHDNQNK